MDNDNMMYVLVVIVAIVAIVGMVVLFTAQQPAPQPVYREPSYAYPDVSNEAGDALKRKHQTAEDEPEEPQLR